ncbi:MAG: Dabb family protein [Candidatus Omnitrophica bacterium]|nr:Dabb family protein [Candidatus Omnitrophota bacterium]
MKRFQLLIPVFLMIGLAGALAFAQVDFSKEHNGLLRHVVCFSFKDDAAPADIQKVVDAFADLPNKIPSIVSFECGTNVSPEGLTKGFTHCFVLTFKTAKDRDAYLPHPDHKAFGKVLGPVMKDVFVIDYWTK